MAVIRNTINPKGLNMKATLPYELRVDDFASALAARWILTARAINVCVSLSTGLTTNASRRPIAFP